MEEDSLPGKNIASILDGMRDEYWQSLNEAEAAPLEVLECVLFRLGSELFACETAYVSEVIRMPTLVKVPRVSGVFAGVFNLHGEITLAIDIRPLLGLPVSPLTKSARILVVKSPAFKTGLLTDAVLEVADLSFSTFSLPASDDISNQFIRGRLNVNSLNVNLLDMSTLLNSPEIVINQTSLSRVETLSETGADHDS